MKTSSSGLSHLSLTDREEQEARKKLRGVLPREDDLVDRLLPFFRIIRLDLRGLPLVIRSGELYVTDSSLRKNTGTHYTPRFLAEEVVEGALEPLVYEPGPLQTADTSEWKLKSSQEILALKVADIAVGSAAFLVAAARYLGDRLIEAWVREGDERVAGYTPPEDGLRADDDKVVIEARRQVIEHSLYGVDINPMAVEMAKLSLWLVSMDPERPFTFLDDRLAAGDSLLGITSLEQLEYMHMDPKQGRNLHGDNNALIDFTSGIRELVSRVAESRRELASVDGTTLDGLNRKRSILGEAELETGRVKLIADLTVGAALANVSRGERGINAGSLAAAELASRLDTAEAVVHFKAKEWLDTDRPDGAFERKPLHWPLTFPEAFDNGGFDAIVGNPPFLGGWKIKTALGESHREYLVEVSGNGVRGIRGTTDLVAYFLLQSTYLLNNRGQIGIVATNSLAETDTRAVGLDQIIKSGTVIRKSVRSKPWPSKSAALEYCAVWTTQEHPESGALYLVDGSRAPGITSSLEPLSRSERSPERLNQNTGICMQGFKILGTGFTMDPKRAQDIIKKDPKSSEVLYPYTNGKDLNTRADLSGSRWVINFRDWSEKKAKEHQECYDQAYNEVRPWRLNDKVASRRERWWQYSEYRRTLIEALSNKSRVIAMTRVSRTAMPAILNSNQIFSEALVVFATEDTAILSVLSSSPHYWWAIKWASGMKSDLRYTGSAVFETLPLPELTQELRELGDQLDTYRRGVMLSRDSGLTKTYNLVFDPECNAPDIQELRAIHRAIDEATIRAYDWEERIEAVGGLDHGFHPVGRETRYTIGPAAQREVLDSLLELNHERYAEEVAQGLHDKKKSKRKASSDEGTLF